MVYVWPSQAVHQHCPGVYAFAYDDGADMPLESVTTSRCAHVVFESIQVRA